jgi:ribosome-associated translation inhibitor RaiA
MRRTCNAPAPVDKVQTGTRPALSETGGMMNIPIEIKFRGVDPSLAVEDYVRKRAAKLETFSTRIIRCHATIEAPGGHHKHGEPYRMRVELKVPGTYLIVGNHSKSTAAAQDVYALIDQTFDEAGRVVQDHVRRRRDETKTQEDQG